MKAIFHELSEWPGAPPGRSDRRTPKRKRIATVAAVQRERLVAGPEWRFKEATPMPFRCRPIPTKNPGDAADLSTPQEFFVRFEGPNPYGAFYSILTDTL